MLGTYELEFLILTTLTNLPGWLFDNYIEDYGF